MNPSNPPMPPAAAGAPLPGSTSASPTEGKNDSGPKEERPFEVLVERPVPGLVRRFLTILRHMMGLILGAFVASSRRASGPGLFRRLGHFLRWFLAQFAKPFVRRELRSETFPIQLRRRLELLGPTYIKLGQVLSLRQDILPKAITEELKNLLDRLPVVPYPRFLELVQEGLPCRIGEAFFTIDETPLGSASIAQIHRAQTLDGDQVILKVVKPGIRETLARDAKLLGFLGWILDIFLSRFRPKQVIQEFVEYTSREVDLRLEADNAETFSANFEDMPDIVFPKIYPQFSGRNVLCMEFFDGIKPDSQEALALSATTKDRIVHLGTSSVIRMLYQDGFFHADLHPANLLILPGPKAGFIDLGMVGRFDEALRRTLLYYYYCLVTGDSENAARYLTAVAEIGPHSDPKGFRRALREIAERWRHRSDFNDFSLAQLILESVNLGGRYRIYFPVEMVLMVKALVTFEGVGNILLPGVNVAEVSKSQINRIFLQQFSPVRVVRESLRNAPELVDAVAKAPMLITEGLRALEKMSREPQDKPFAGLRGTLFGGFCMVAGAILAAAEGPWPVWAALFALGIGVQLRRKH